MDSSICKVSGCNKPRYSSKGFCTLHNDRYRRHVDDYGRVYNELLDRLERNLSIVVGGCWEHSTQPGHRYARVWEGGVERLAHRVAYEVWRGPIPEDLLVCHECDNPPCCNPGHLFLGTNTDNMQDMRAKGRGNYAQGEQTRHARLTEAQALEAKRLLAQGVSRSDIAVKFGITRAAVRLIDIGKNWKHIKLE